MHLVLLRIWNLSISKARELSKGSDSRLKVSNWSFVIVVILMSIPGLTLASGTHADYDQIFTSANAAYMNGDYEGAVGFTLKLREGV